jgi:hypothetical protein
MGQGFLEALEGAEAPSRLFMHPVVRLQIFGEFLEARPLHSDASEPPLSDLALTLLQQASGLGLIERARTLAKRAAIPVVLNPQRADLHLP